MYTFTKTSSSDKAACADIMQRIYSEEPNYWPHGCSMELFESNPSTDEVYLIKHAGQPVGFTGWQERIERGVKVGYYAIGILPEHRQQGLAKKAVARLITQKRAGVDRVQAAIVPTNTPSLNLAKRLQVPVVKAATVMTACGQVGRLLEGRDAIKALLNMPGMRDAGNFDPATGELVVKSAGWKKPLQMLLGGAATSAGADFALNGGSYEHITPLRMMNGAVNFGMGALGVGSIAKGLKGTAGLTGPALTDALARQEKALNMGMASLTGIPLKDLAIGATTLVPKADRALDSITEANNRIAPPNTPALSPKEKLALIAALGVGGLGLAGGAYALSRAGNRIADRQNGGRVKVRLPTRDPNDQETTVDMPVDDANISPNLVSMMFRDTRRKLRQESTQRTWHRGVGKRVLTNGSRLSPAEEAELEKNSAITPANIKPLKGGPVTSSLSPAQNPEQQQQLTDLQQQSEQAKSEQEKAKSDFDKQTGDLTSKLQQSQTQMERAQHQMGLENDQLKHELKLKELSGKAGESGHPALASVAKKVSDLHQRAQQALYKVAAQYPNLMLKLALGPSPLPNALTLPPGSPGYIAPAPGVTPSSYRPPTAVPASAPAPTPASAIKPMRGHHNPGYVPLNTPGYGRMAIPENVVDQGAFMKDLSQGSPTQERVTDFAYQNPQERRDWAFNAAGGKELSSDPSIPEIAKNWAGSTASSMMGLANGVVINPAQRMTRQYLKGQAQMGNTWQQISEKGWNAPGSALWEGVKGLGNVVASPLSLVNPFAAAANYASNLYGGSNEDWKGGTPPAGAGAAGAQYTPAAPAESFPTVSAYGPTGALNILNRAGGSIPSDLRYDKDYQNQIKYDNPYLGGFMNLAGSVLTPGAPSTITGRPDGPGFLQQVMSSILGG